MGFCECTYCAELFYDWDEYAAHECDLQGLYPEAWNFTWEVTKQLNVGQTVCRLLVSPKWVLQPKKKCRVKNYYEVLTEVRW